MRSLEQSVEQKFRAMVQQAGGFEMKLTGVKGIPDRLVVLGGKVSFIELKRPKGGSLEPAQIYMIGVLKRNGANVGHFNNADEAFKFCQ